MKYSYHIHAVFTKYNEKYEHSLNTIIQVPFKVVDSNTYDKFKDHVIDEYRLGMEIDTIRLVITSMSLLHVEEEV